MVAYVEYARITPKELDKVVCTVCPNAYVMSYPVEYADDMYEAVVCFVEPPTTLEEITVNMALAPYLDQGAP